MNKSTDTPASSRNQINWNECMHEKVYSFFHGLLCLHWHDEYLKRHWNCCQCRTVFVFHLMWLCVFLSKYRLLLWRTLSFTLFHSFQFSLTVCAFFSLFDYEILFGIIINCYISISKYQLHALVSSSAEDWLWNAPLIALNDRSNLNENEP